MADLYRRNHDHTVTCKFCGAHNLKWSEIAPGKARLHETTGAVHDCKEYHESKRNGGLSGPPNAPERDSAVRRLNAWMQRWNALLTQDAADEIEEIIDDMVKR